MNALHIHAGPLALQVIRHHGLQARHIGTLAAAAGGPKGLLLGALDRFIFGDWLPGSGQPVDLVGASIGAWRMATACLNQPMAGFDRLEHDYVHQHYEMTPGQERPSAATVSAVFGQNLQAFFADRVPEILAHPRYRLHIVTARGRHLLHTGHGLRTPLGFLGAYVSNALHRKALGAWLERVVFSQPFVNGSGCAALPFASDDYPTRQVALSAANFTPALQASCAIPFVLQAVQHIPGAPPGAYWDGGMTDYHLHLNYPGAAKYAIDSIAASAINKGVSARSDADSALVLYPHFQRTVVPGWLDKRLRWRHRATPFLDTLVLLAPNPDWVKTLPNGKLPDRTDFTRYGRDLAARVKAWRSACSASTELADEFAAWLARPDPSQVRPL